MLRFFTVSGVASLVAWAALVFVWLFGDSLTLLVTVASGLTLGGLTGLAVLIPDRWH